VHFLPLAVLSCEGKNIKQNRIIRSIKHRYRATNDIGIFSMPSIGWNSPEPGMIKAKLIQE
jgi:predicted ATP-dependent serine protease